MSKRTASVLVLSIVAALAGCDVSAPPPAAAPFATAIGGDAPALRPQVDATRHRAWTLGPDGVSFQDLREGQSPRVLPLPGWTWIYEPFARFPGLALGPNGEAVITSNAVATLWRIDPDTLAVTVHPLALDSDQGRDIGFSALTWSARHGAFFAVSDGDGSLWKIDPLLRRAQRIPLSTPLIGAAELSVAAASARPRTERFAALCAVSPREAWMVAFAPDLRSAYPRAASWRECPSLMNAISLRGD